MGKLFRSGLIGPLQLCLLLWLIGSGSHACAQRLIDLSKATPVVVPEGIYIDSVLASFSDSARIGTVMRGLGNKAVPAFLAGGVAKGIQGILVNPPGDEGVRHCTMRVNALEISEVSGSTSERCYCGLNFELLTRTDSGWVRFFDHAATSAVGGGLDATGKQPENIATGVTEGFAEYSRMQQAGTLPVPVIVHPPKAGVFDGQDRAYPVLTVGAPARGSYPDFMSLRDQQVDTSLNFTLKPVGKNEQLFKLKTTRDDPAPNDLWGVSDGRYLYINVGNRFLRMDRAGNEFSANYNHTGSTQGEVAGAVAVGVAFGLIGVGLYYAMSSGSEMIPLRLDMLTGSLVHADHHGGEGAKKEETSDHLFLYSRHCPVDTTVNIFVYGGLETALQQEGYHVVSLVPRPGPVPVEIQVGEGLPTGIEIITGRTGGDPDVYLIKVGKDGTPTVDRLTGEMASSILKKLDPAKEVK
ncbi:MAG: hypothetical protein K8H89_04725 [Flavobacteriales bacterium]|nr:hypothetical protein [Flavobacteriales bacterium]